MADRKLFIGLDVGGTSVKMGLFDEAGELLGKGSVPTPPLIDSAGYTAVTDGITALLGAASEQAEQVRGIGLAIPCPVPADGVIRMQANIQINAPGLQAALERHCPTRRSVSRTTPTPRPWASSGRAPRRASRASSS